MSDDIKGIENIWKTMNKGYNETSEIILGIKEKGHKDLDKQRILEASRGKETNRTSAHQQQIGKTEKKT